MITLPCYPIYPGVGPIHPLPLGGIMNQFIFEFLKLSAILVVVACITQIINVVMKKRGFRVNCLSNHLILLLFSTILFLFGGLSVWMVKGIIFAWILLFASVQDLSTREADDFLWVMLLILSLVNFSTDSIVSMLVGALVIFVPQMAIAMFGKIGGIGGADIKISTAAALMLGFWRGITGYLIGLLFAIVFTLIYNKVRHIENDKSFALMPFLSVGLLVGYLI